MTHPKTTLIKGGLIVTPEGVSIQDILIEGERIKAIGQLKEVEVAQEIPAQDLLIFPGAVDTHVNFNDYFMNTVSVHNFFTGTLAAAYGGVTAIVDFANQEKGHTLQEALDSKKKEAEGQALIDWGIHPVITEPTPAPGDAMLT